MNPYIEHQIDNNIVIRTFKESTDSEDFMWHRDQEDRVIYPIVDTDWLIQLDNELPKKIEAGIRIQAGVWHRLIKGSGELRIRIER
jgi:hypothetical protein